MLGSDEISTFVSIAVCAIRSFIGKLSVPLEFYDVAAGTYVILSIELGHLAENRVLPMHDCNPFDRMLVVQAR